MTKNLSRREFITTTAGAAAAMAIPAISLAGNEKTSSTAAPKQLKSANVLIIHGSPKVDGNTSELVDVATAFLKENGHTVDRVNIVDEEVSPCIGCMACQENAKEIGCIYEDDGTFLLNKIIAADAVIITSPLYFGTFTAVMKPLIDRCFALSCGFGTANHTSLVEGKRVMFLSTGGGEYKNNGEILAGSCKDFTHYLKLDSYDFFYAQSTPAVATADKRELSETMKGFI